MSDVPGCGAKLEGKCQCVLELGHSGSHVCEFEQGGKDKLVMWKGE